MRAHISHTATNYNSPKIIKSPEKLASERIAKKALWLGVMPVGMNRDRPSFTPEYVGLYYHTIRIGRHPAGNGLHHFRAQILEPRRDEPAFEYEPLKTAGGIRAIVAASVAVEFLETALPQAWQIVVTQPSPFNPGVKDIPMPLEDIARAKELVEHHETQEIPITSLLAPQNVVLP